MHAAAIRDQFKATFGREPLLVRYPVRFNLISSPNGTISISVVTNGGTDGASLMYSASLIETVIVQRSN